MKHEVMIVCRTLTLMIHASLFDIRYFPQKSNTLLASAPYLDLSSLLRAFDRAEDHGQILDVIAGCCFGRAAIALPIETPVLTPCPLATGVLPTCVLRSRWPSQRKLPRVPMPRRRAPLVRCNQRRDPAWSDAEPAGGPCPPRRIPGETPPRAVGRSLPPDPPVPQSANQPWSLPAQASCH